MTQKQNDKQSSSKPFPEKVSNTPAQNKSESQPDGTAAGSPRGETQAHAAQFNKGLADDGNSGVDSDTPERRTGINPSAPTNSTEGGTTSMPQNPTMDSAGEVGEPTGKGNMSMKDENMNKNNQQGPQTTQQNKQGGQQNQSGNEGQQNRQGGQQTQGSQGDQNSQIGEQQKMSGRSDRQESGSQGSGSQSGQQEYRQGEQSGSSEGSNMGQSGQNRQGQQSGSQSGQNQSSQDQKKSGKTSEFMDEDQNKGDRKTA